MRQVQLIEENLGHAVVIMLAGMHQDRLYFFMQAQLGE